MSHSATQGNSFVVFIVLEFQQYYNDKCTSHRRHYYYCRLKIVTVLAHYVQFVFIVLAFQESYKEKCMSHSATQGNSLCLWYWNSNSTIMKSVQVIGDTIIIVDLK